MAIKIICFSSFNTSHNLQVVADPAGGFKGWPANKKEEEVDPLTIHRFSELIRCTCTRRVTYQAQCGAELLHFGFDIGMWDSRWYNLVTYCQRATDFKQAGSFTVSNQIPIGNQEGELDHLDQTQRNQHGATFNGNTIYVNSHEAANHLTRLTDNNYVCDLDVADPHDLDGGNVVDISQTTRICLLP
jgi:hypothetical protein